MHNLPMDIEKANDNEGEEKGKSFLIIPTQERHLYLVKGYTF